MLAEKHLPPTLMEEADGIGRRVRRLQAVLNGMRAYTVQPALSFQSERLEEILHEAVDVAIESGADRSGKPSVEIRVPSSVVIEASRPRLVQALTNILVNAAEAYPEDAVLRPIEITAGIEDRLVRMTIRDFGCGMSEEDQRDSLTLFSTNKANGTGFGLPLAVKIVESEHGGRLSLESAKGQGTSVHILLPKHRGDATMKSRHRALIVEDEAETSFDLGEILKSLDCDSVPVTNAEHAMRELETGSFCLVLLDLEIKAEPDAIKGHVEYGKSLLRKIRHMNSEHIGLRFWLPVLVISGFARERDEALELMKDGATDVIQKPIDSHAVSQAIRKALVESGRETHDRCEDHPVVPRDNFKEKVVIAIPGDRSKRRTSVRLGSQSVTLTDSSLRVLLHLILGHLQNKRCIRRIWARTMTKASRESPS